MTEQSLTVQAIQVEGGRFKELLTNVKLTDECFDCETFNPNAVDNYLCACMGTCIGITLSKEFNEYLLVRMNIL